MTTNLEMSQHKMKSWDGAELFYRAWRPRNPSDKAVLLFHRGHEHSGRMAELVRDLALDDCNLFAWDMRGHGLSPGERGSAESVAALIKDVDAFVRFVSVQHGIPVENMVIVGHSVGAALIAAWVHDYAPSIRGMVLATPAFRVKLYVPFAISLLRLKQALFGKSSVKSYVKASMLTHDSDQAAEYHADEMVFRQISVKILLGLHDTSTRVVADAAAIVTPTLLLVAGSDWIVKLSAQIDFFRRLSSPKKRMQILPQFYHSIFHERDRSVPIATSREFIRELFATPPKNPSLIDADRDSPTRAEYVRISKPTYNPLWMVTRLMLKTIGRLSQGLRLGWRTGFDSGVTLDYVYANRPRGITPLGRFIDWAYLNTIGWRGIRQRKAHLQKALATAIEQIHSRRKPVRLLDIASGPGRYVLETIKENSHIKVSALLRDFHDVNLSAGREMAHRMNLSGVEFCQGDAFDRGALAITTPSPTIAIVSGLYELFPDNERVVNSLRGVADSMQDGGLLIYTNQPWHPQVELIARVLDNREHKPWIMRRRTQGEMDELVRLAGFEKKGMEIDEWGIFSVSIAERKA